MIVAASPVVRGAFDHTSHISVAIPNPYPATPVNSLKISARFLQSTLFGPWPDWFELAFVSAFFILALRRRFHPDSLRDLSLRAPIPRDGERQPISEKLAEMLILD